MGYKFEDLAKLQPGDVIYECQSGLNLKARVLTAPVPSDGVDGRSVLSWTAENAITGEPINYMVTDGLMHYGPRLYAEPQYVSRVEIDGEMVLAFALLGGGVERFENPAPDVPDGPEL